MLALDVVIERGAFSLSADLVVERGARVAVMGPSGAGKSTLLEAVAGFVPASGAMRWDGVPLDGPPGERPAAILFQDANLFPHLTVERNAALGVRPSGRLSPGERATVARALERVGLGGLEGRRPAALSGGQRGRAALARVLLMRRPLLLLDEPFAALGPALKAEMLALVGEVLGEIDGTLLMVTHDPGDARALATHLVVVSDGRAVPPAPVAALDDPAGQLAAYLGTRRARPLGRALD